MKIDELVRRLPQDKIMTQLVDESVLGATARKGYTELRIATTGMHPGDLFNAGTSAWQGFIVWVDRAEADAVFKAGPQDFSALLKEVRSAAQHRAEAADGMEPVESYEADDPVDVQQGLRNDADLFNEIADALVALGVS